MPDIRTALQAALSKPPEKVMDTNTLNAWDQGTADSRAEQGKPGRKLFPITNNITRDLFNFVRDNPGRTFFEIKEGLPGNNPNSMGSLLTQMIKQGLMRREGQHLRYRYYAIVPEYVPLKARLYKQAKSNEKLRKKLVIVRKKIEDKQEQIAAVSASNAGLAALKVDTTPADTRQVSGNHYRDMPVQPWSVMESVLTHEEFKGFLKGNIIKYSMRAGRKPGSDDAGKAAHYQQKLKEIEGT